MQAKLGFEVSQCQFHGTVLTHLKRNFQSTDEEQCSKYLEYINLLCNFAILYFDISENKVSRMHILLIMIFLNTLNHLQNPAPSMPVSRYSSHSSEAKLDMQDFSNNVIGQ